MPRFTNRITILLGVVLTLLVASSTTWAQPSLSLGSAIGCPGQTLTVPLTEQNNSAAVALQLEVQFEGAKLSVGSPSGGGALSPDKQFANAAAGAVTPGALSGGKITIRNGSSKTLVASVLPISRSVKRNVVTTVFATIIDIGCASANGVTIALKNQSLPITFTYQATDPITHQVVGMPNTPVTIPGDGVQNFILSLQATQNVSAQELEFVFKDSSNAQVGKISGVNTLFFSAVAPASTAADVVALAATFTNDGIVNIPGPTGTGVFAVATINLGDGEQVTATADTGNVSLPISPAICQTDPATGCYQQGCVVPTASSVTITINPNQTPTFGIFVKGTGTVPFDPATNRIFVRFKNGSGALRGTTSVAVRTVP